MVDRFADEAALVGSARILDAGCGTGRMTRYLADRGCSIEGLDLSPAMIDVARRERGDLEFSVGALADLPYPNDSFAGVMLWYSIIHTPSAQLEPIFAEVARVLHRGGFVLVGFQAGQGVRDLAATYRRLGHEIDLKRHLHSADQVASGLETAGLRELVRLIRRRLNAERDDQAFLLARGR